MDAVPGALSLHAALISFSPGVGDPLKSLPSCPRPLLSACQRGRDQHHPRFSLKSSSVTVGEGSEMGQPGTVPVYLEWPPLGTSRSIYNQGSSEGLLFQT